MIFSASAQIIIIFIAILLVGLFLGEQRMQRIALSAFVGLVIADNFSDILLKVSSSQKLFNPTITIAKITLFTATVLLLSFHKKSDFFVKSKISVKSAILSFLSAGFISTTILSFLSPETFDKLVTDYNLISMLYAFRYWFMGLTVVWIIIMSFWPKSKKDKDLK